MTTKAIVEARRQIREGPHCDTGICLIMVRKCYEIAATGNVNMDGDADSFDAWQRAHFEHRETLSDHRRGLLGRARRR